MLVSAPAGFGKTTLVAAWLSESTPAGDRRPGSPLFHFRLIDFCI
jgi:hypothetical protein